MTENKQLQALLQYVMKKYVWTEVGRVMNRAVRIHHVDMDEEDRETLVAFIAKVEKCDHGTADRIFVEAKRKAEACRTQEQDKKFGVCLLITCLISMVTFGMLSWLLNIVGMESGPAGLAALLLSAALFVILLFTWVWNPRYRAMNEVWISGGGMEDHLDELYEILQMPMGQLILQRQKKQLGMFAGGIVAIPVVALLPVIVIVAVSMMSPWQSEFRTDYQEEMALITVSADNAGTRYVVYNVDDNKYTGKYIPEEKRADTADDVRAVLQISEGVSVVGQYQDGGSAYQRYVTIEVIDQRTGSVVLSDTVYGGGPPRTVRTRSGMQAVGYGSHPSTSDISDACAELISIFEAMK